MLIQSDLVYTCKSAPHLVITLYYYMKHNPVFLFHLTSCNLSSAFVLSSDLLPGQRAIAMISEMIHTASLVHDDVIDGSDKRRGKGTINEIWGEKKVRGIKISSSSSSEE